MPKVPCYRAFLSAVDALALTRFRLGMSPKDARIEVLARADEAAAERRYALALRRYQKCANGKCCGGAK